MKQKPAPSSPASTEPTAVTLHRLLSEKGLQPRYAKDQEPLPEQTVVRERFANRRDFITTFIAFVIGPSNLWRFPYLVFKNGGAVFVFVYLVVVLVVGVPVSFMELALGQFSGKNSVRVWNFCPAFRGVGFSCLLVCWLTSVTFQLVMAHYLCYAIISLGHSFPWSNCKPKWDNCFAVFNELKNWTEKRNVSFCAAQQQQSAVPSCLCHGDIQSACLPAPTVAAHFFYYEDVLRVEGFGTPAWEVVVLLLFSWSLVMGCMVCGCQFSLSKCMYLTVLVPYLGQMILLGQAGSEKGVSEGVNYVLGTEKVHWEKLKGSQIWMDAVSQALFSMNAVLGELFLTGSILNFRNKYLHWDLFVVTVVDVLTSVLVALTVFMTLSHASHEAGPDYNIEDILQSDLGVSFLAFPTILISFPMPHLWTTIFFVMLYTLAIDASFGLVETVLTYLHDDFRLIRKNTAKTKFLFGALSFAFSVLLACSGGNDMVRVIDQAAISLCLPLLALVEVCSVMWAYGVKNFLSDLEYMLAVKLTAPSLLTFHYALFLPCCLMAVSIASLAEFPSEDAGYKAAMLCVVLLPVPLWFLLYAAKVFTSHPHLSWGEMGSTLLMPSTLWGPNDGSNIHRNRNTVFAELWDRLKSSLPSHSMQDVPEFPVRKSLGREEERDRSWDAGNLLDAVFMPLDDGCHEGGNSPQRRSISLSAPQHSAGSPTRRNTLA